MAILLSGCANMTKEKIGDIFLAVLAARLSQPGYDYRQGLQDGQNQQNSFYNMQLIEMQKYQMLKPNFGFIQCNKNTNKINCTQNNW